MASVSEISERTKAMHRSFGLLILAIMSASPAEAACQSGWRPTPSQIAQLEAHLRLPPRAHGLATYDRYYAGVCKDGHGIVLGVLDWNAKPGSVHIVAEQDLPGILDGGCSVIDVAADIRSLSTPTVSCHGYA